MSISSLAILVAAGINVSMVALLAAELIRVFAARTRGRRAAVRARAAMVRRQREAALRQERQLAILDAMWHDATR